MIRLRQLSTLSAMLAILASCGEEPDETVTEEPETEEVEPVPFDSIPMPDYPLAQRGRLTVASAGDFALDGSWDARAAVCDDPAVLQVLAEQPGVGTLILLQLPPHGERVTHYPIMVVDSGVPVAPAAQIGVQLFQDANAFAFQGAEGEVELTEYDDLVSGRFAVTLREIATQKRQRYAGVFEAVTIEQLPAAHCAAMRDAMYPADSGDAEDAEGQ